MGDRVLETLDVRGIRKGWFAAQLGVSVAYLWMLTHGTRRWTPRLRARAAAVLELPEHVLFFAGKSAKNTRKACHNDNTN